MLALVVAGFGVMALWRRRSSRPGDGAAQAS
ncbi:MAG TPA: hypothetical protein H9903_12700 [Candidatus Aquabacterium excrementipullorum]|nr:hypothetical protein [Candidatus Aquabacterium excrementipullorum]